MTSATLYREGDDLDLLLAELDAEYPGQVRVVEVSYPRTGGIGGFFAKQRVGVQFALNDAAARPRPKPGAGAHGSRPRPRPTPTPAPRRAAAPIWIETREPQYVETRDLPAGGALSGLVAEADARDNVRRGDDGSSNADFAQLLLDLAAKKSARRVQASREGWVAQRPSIAREAEQVTAASRLPNRTIQKVVMKAPAMAEAAIAPGFAESASAEPAFAELAANELPSAASPVIDSLIADAIAGALGASGADAPEPTSTAAVVFEPIAAPVLETPAVEASIAEEPDDAELESSLEALLESSAAESAAPVRRRRPTTGRTPAPNAAAKRATGRRSAAKKAETPAPVNEFVSKISVPDLALRSLTSATAAVVAGDSLSSSQKDVMKDLRDKLADVVVLLDKLGEAGIAS
jgi:hypothetical protein